MRIAHFVQRYPPALGGSEAYFARLSRYFVEQGDQVTVFTTQAFDLEAFWDPRAARLPAGTFDDHGVEVRRFPLRYFPGQRYLLKALSLLPIPSDYHALALAHNPVSPAMWRAAGRPDTPFDIVHATAFPYGWPPACALRLARRLRVPFVLTPFVHTGDPDDPHDRTRRGYTRPCLVRLAHAADRLFVQTDLEGEALRARGVAEGKIIVQGMGFDPESCTGGDRAKLRRELGVRGDEVLVGHLANKSREKGTVDLLEAARIAWGRGAKFRVVIAGPDMSNFREFWSRYSEAKRVCCLGVLDEQQKRDFFAALDVFALPSRSDSFGIVLLEAWANGIPNVGYRAGGIAGVIRHETDGLLVKCGEVEGLAQALIVLEREKALRRRLGETGKERAYREGRWEEKLALVHGVYDWLLQTKGLGPKPAE